jgi:hypothetical protein
MQSTSDPNQSGLNVLYIAGNGHSGSTLLDIMLGSTEGFFSGGELTFITRDSIFEEYCSCGQLIPECEIWSEIIDRWEKNRKVTYREYQQLRLRFERNKTSIVALKNRFFPSKDFKRYCEATREFFESIRAVTGARVIIDSSKGPARIPVLDRISDVQVIHLCRDFKGVLNSAKKSSKKDIKAGIEADNPARSTNKTLLDWLLNNLLCEIFCLGVKSKKVLYKDYVQRPELLQKVRPELDGLPERAPYTAPHMLAGNVIRLKKELRIDPQIGFQYKRLNSGQFKMASLIDRLFWFWSYPYSESGKTRPATSPDTVSETKMDGQRI